VGGLATVTAAALLLAVAPPRAQPRAPGGAPDATLVLAQVEAAHASLFARTAPAVVFIRTAEGFGSGFFVSGEGHVLTNRHVVGRATTVDVVTHAGQTLRGKVVARGDKGLDLAVVKVDATDTPSLRLATSRDVPIGAWVGSVGHGSGGIWTLSTGFVSNAYGAAAHKGVLQTQIPLNPGASGGPVFDRQGRVVGVVTSGIEAAQAINFAIRSDTAVQGLPYLRSLTDCLVVEAAPKSAIFVDGQLIGRGASHALLLTAGTHEVTAVLGAKRMRETIEFPRDRRVTLLP
jgi:S1-C subfamily serine protease